MRIRLDSPIEDLVFRFKISAGYASKFFKKLWEVFYIYIYYTYISVSYPVYFSETTPFFCKQSIFDPLPKIV